MKLSLLFITVVLSAELIEERDIVSDVLGPWINDLPTTTTSTGTTPTRSTTDQLIFTTPTTRVTSATSNEFPTFTTPSTRSTTTGGFWDALFAPASTASSTPASSSSESTLSEYPSELLAYLTRSSSSARSSSNARSSSTSEYPSQLLAYLTRDASSFSSVASSVASDLSSVASDFSSVASEISESESSSSTRSNSSTRATTTESNDLLQYLTGSETFYPSNLVAYISSRTRGSFNDTTQTTVAAQQTVVTGSISFQSTVSDTMSSEDAANKLLGPVLGSMALILISLI